MLLGGRHADEIYGNNGSDEINGGLGKDSLYGGRGDDLIMGGRGDDQIDGGKGDDVMYSGLGEDMLSGGKGSDLFVFDEVDDTEPVNVDLGDLGAGGLAAYLAYLASLDEGVIQTKTITDFTSDVDSGDKLDVSSLYDGFDDVMWEYSEDAGGVLMQMDVDEYVLLTGVMELVETDFLFI